MTTRLLHDAVALLDRAVEAYEATPGEGLLRVARARAEEPLRVAIAGKVKAGKSTLLNALVGEELAPTDAGECTRVVTWYRDSHTYRVTLEPHEGEPRQARFDRDDGSLAIELAEFSADDLARIVVDWPSEWLRAMTLIDTPGIDSLSANVSARTTAFLSPSEEEPTPADAVLYLMRHLHANDMRFLETFHDEEVSRATPINAVAVLSRADEIGVGRLDAMEAAAGIAERYRSDARVRRLVQTVVPVSGLLAESGTTLRQDEFEAFRALAAVDAAELQRRLVAADRFVRDDGSLDVPADVRHRLLLRFGVFGVRLGVTLVHSGEVDGAQQLATELVARSGLNDLRRTLSTLFAARADVLKARSALLAVEGVLRGDPRPDPSLVGELERIESGAHEFAELRLLSALRSGALVLPGNDGPAAERLLGSEGPDVRTRLGLEAGADDQDVRGALAEAVALWNKGASRPMAGKDASEAARLLVRTCEGMAALLAPPGDGAAQPEARRQRR